MRKAQSTAFEKKKKIEVIWRGHKEVVEPTGSKFTSSDLRDRLLLALKGIMKKQKMDDEEEKVIKKLTGRQENINNFTTPPPLTIRNLKKKKNDSEV